MDGLSVDLVSVAGQAGHDTQQTSPMPARLAGKTGTSRATAHQADFILVTNTASDFRRLDAAEPLHAGLGILIPSAGRVLQQRLFRAALAELAVIAGPVNRVLEVDLNGEEVILTLYDLPPDAP